MTFPRVLLVAVALFACRDACADIGIGDTRDAVIRQAGNPTSRAQRGNREILIYPGGARVELQDGMVSDVEGTLPKVTPAPETPAAAPAAPNAAPKTAAPKPAPSSAQRSPPAATKKGSTDYAVQYASNPDIITQGVSKELEKMGTAWGQRPPIPTKPTAINVPKLLVSIVLHFVITLLALRIAFKIEEMDALWSGVFAIAGIDVGLYAALELLGPVTNGLSSMGALESGVGALVMIFTIQKFCFTKKLQYAVVTAMSVKLIVRLCHMFVFVLLLNALFG